MINTDNNGHDDILLCKEEEDYIDSTTLKYNNNSHEQDIINQLAGSGTIGVAAAAAILSSKHNSRHNYHFETNPAVRKRQQTRLLRKLNELADEYAARCGQQICVICCTPTIKSLNKQTIFKAFGTQPLETVVKNQRSNIISELDNLLESTIIDENKHEIHDHHNSTVATSSTVTTASDEMINHQISATTSRFELPSLTIDGIPTSLEKMTQCQLRMFIPLLLKYSTGRQKPGWNRIECKPVWWPSELPWANIRVDPRDDEGKKKHPWTEVLKQVIRNCYTYHGREDLLHKFNNVNNSSILNDSKHQNKKTSTTIKSSIQHQQQQQQHQKHEDEQQQHPQSQSISLSNQTTYTILQQVTSLDGILTVIPLSSATMQPNSSSASTVNNNSSRLPIILQTDSSAVDSTLLQQQQQRLDFNMNEYHHHHHHNLWTTSHHEQQQQHMSSIPNNHLLTATDMIMQDEDEDDASKEDNIIELACLNKNKRDNNEATTSIIIDTNNNIGDCLNTTATVPTTEPIATSMNCHQISMNNDYNDLQMIKHKRFRLGNTNMIKNVDHQNNKN